MSLDLVLVRILDFIDRNPLGKSFTYHELLYWIIRIRSLVGLLIVIVIIGISIYVFRRRFEKR